MPERVRLKGYPKKPIVPKGALFIARPGKWGNRHRVGECKTCDGRTHDRDEAVALFREDLLDGRLSYTVTDVRAKMAGRDLACWCAQGESCHGDVLLALSNEEWSEPDLP